MYFFLLVIFHVPIISNRSILPKVSNRPSNKDILPWYSLIKCKVVPPRKLYHPVLPQRIKVVHKEEEGKKKKSIVYEKLIFTLCKACAETRNQNKCKHTDKERSFIGTWTTDEFNKAIEKGYKVLRTYEVWHFNKSTDDPCQKIYKNKAQI